MRESNFILVAKKRDAIKWVLIDKRRQQVWFVYALQCEDTSRVKIGITQNLEQRLKDIRSMCSTKLRLILLVPVMGPEVEAMLHRRFDRFRLHGEWFAIPPSKIDDLISLRRDYDVEMEEYRKIENRSDKEREAIRSNGFTVETLNEVLREQDFDSQERMNDLSSSDFEPKPIREFWNQLGSKCYEASIENYYPIHNRF